ncbi:MAG: polysaccharide biosynthesis protein [Deltaproteobacteria bacterium]|nr:MAG: polysaccharide biosynthesis protein [Deltaproteobacteria bacterium]
MSKVIAEKRIWFVVVIQVAIIVASLLLAFLFRFDMRIPEKFQPILPALLPPLIVIKLLFFWYLGLLRGWWRYVSMADLITILKANLLASLAFVAYAVIVYRLEKIPRSVLILDGIFCFLMMGGIRFLTRAFRENYLPMPRSRPVAATRVLIVGAGDAGQAIAREIRQNPRLNLEAVGFVDDDPQKQGVAFQGIKVLGRQESLARICENRNIDEVIIAIPSASGPQVRGIVEKCQEAGVRFKTLPGVGDLIDGRVSVQSIRDVALEDLLGREPIVLEVERIRAYLKGKRVLVSGAGGSIGSEICRQVVQFQPGKLILLDNAETPLFNIERELVAHFPDIPLSPVVGDIRHRARIEAIFDQYLPEVVFHAAAYKHVPMMEHNPAEAVNNNVRGTQVLADAAHEHAVETFVMISTDKAVNPTNVMGASKRAAELYVQGLARESRTRFVTVRFGNVLGSNGSVVPIFREQIARGGPVTVTHPEVTRFFMTIPEATQLVLQAGSMGKGGEILLLDMGEPVRILHLAEELIRLSGLRPHEDIEIVFTGLRPGEKLYEELLLTGEGIVPTTHASIMIANAARCDREFLLGKLEQLYAAARNMDRSATLALLGEIVPEFRPEDAGSKPARAEEKS